MYPVFFSATMPRSDSLVHSVVAKKCNSG